VIAEAGNRADEPLVARVVAEQPARAQDRLRQLRFGNVRLAPDRRTEFVAADGARTMFDQIGDAVEHACGSRDRFAIATQFACRGRKPVSTEMEDDAFAHGIDGRSHERG